MLEELRERTEWSKECEALSIYHELSKIQDLRGKRGKRYGLALLLTCVLLAKMAGETTLQAISEWIRLRSTWLQQVLPETRATFPCAATHSNVLRGVDQAQVNQVLMDLLTRVRTEKRTIKEQMHVVLDRKMLRGTQHHLAEDQKNMHHMHLMKHRRVLSSRKRWLRRKRMTWKRSCVVREGADGTGPAMVPRQRPTS
ncbi:transposase family protein [Dictyobacter arantiisoli]|uniref:transposase family protein n=1 Tax=Dictyobacter arantiisoli TaxID=2014874 RepID=UPI00353061AD